MVLSIDLIFLALCILSGAFVIIKYKPALYLRLLTFTLILNFIIDTIATIILLNGGHTNYLYNIYNIFYFELYLFIMYSIVKSAKAKRVMFNTMIAFAIIGIVNLFFIQLFQNFQTFTFSLGCLLIVAFCIYYFFELFLTPSYIKLVYEPSFWLATGLLFYYCCIFPIASILNIVGNDLPEKTVNFYQALTVLVNILMYCLFTIAFVCRMKIRKYTS